MTFQDYQKTKILATVGPAIEEDVKLRWLIENGVYLFRLNFKHNTIDWHKNVAERIRKIARELKKDVAIVIDLQGPSIRFIVPQGQINVQQGVPIFLVSRPQSVGEVGISYPYVSDLLQDDMFVYAGDGELAFKVSRQGSKIQLLPLISGVLRDRVAFTVQDLDIHGLPVLTERDKKAVKLIQKGLVDMLALSFVNDAQQVRESKSFFKQQTGVDLPIISKLETRAAFYNLDEILDVSEAIMVARGDLALQTPFFKLTYYQKEIIKRSREKAVPVIVATQMLQSMVEKPFPTRAEISDVANSVLDGPDVIMLSGETAMGKFPIRTIQIMQRIISFYEKQENHAQLTQSQFMTKREFELGGDISAVVSALYNWALYPDETNIRLVVVFGSNLHMLDRIAALRLKVPLVFVTSKEALVALSRLRFGVLGTIILSSKEYSYTVADKERIILQRLTKAGLLKPRQKVIFVGMSGKSDNKTTYIHMLQV